MLKQDKVSSDIYSWYQGIHTKWWENDMKGNMKSIKSQDDFDEQLLMAGDKFTVVHFFSPSCRACKALHSKVKEDKGCRFNNFTIISCFT
jgi:thiol-disulfide isomerase/thioredoxin